MACCAGLPLACSDTCRAARVGARVRLACKPLTEPVPSMSVLGRERPSIFICLCIDVNREPATSCAIVSG